MDKDKKIRVLILIDCQRDFIDGSLANKDAQKAVPNIVQKIKDFDGNAIIYTMDTHGADYLNTLEGKKLPVEHCILGSDGWKLESAIHEAIKKKQQAGMMVTRVLKETFGSDRIPYDEEHKDWVSLPIAVRTVQVVVSHSLDEDAGTLEIEMCGFISDICVLHNAIILKANTYGNTEITVDSKCCAGSTPENHQKAMDLLKIGQINVI